MDNNQTLYQSNILQDDVLVLKKKLLPPSAILPSTERELNKSYTESQSAVIDGRVYLGRSNIVKLAALQFLIENYNEYKVFQSNYATKNFIRSKNIHH
jgi:hypothetical protein